MSNTERDPVEQPVCSTGTSVATEPDLELLRPREVPLGGPRAMRVRRVLPNRERRMIGAWCFADSYGPADIAGEAGMQVPPHPHTGLQTVTWLNAGEVLHRDSLGRRELIHPGELALMTAGHGIAHAEQSPQTHSSTLYGAQLWIALPDHARSSTPAFEFHTELPRLELAGGSVTVIAGELDRTRSPASVHSPLVGAALTLAASGRLTLPLESDFEHGILALGTGLTVEGTPLQPGELAYLGRGRARVTVGSDAGGEALLLGGEPFAEDLVMWWNFLGRAHENIVEARAVWEREHDSTLADRRFGAVGSYEGPALPAPTMPNTRLRARGRYQPRRSPDSHGRTPRDGNG